jgi:TetR/AcrR family transcriptional regulator
MARKSKARTAAQTGIVAPARALDDESVLPAPSTAKEKAIIEAAVGLIGDRGIDGATTAEIARRAGVTEKTLFRYFPSKKDLVKRALFPLLMQSGLAQQWGQLEQMIRNRGFDLKTWYAAAAMERFAQVTKNPTRTANILVELAQNEELREAVLPLWRKYIWAPMVEELRARQASGELRKDLDVEVLARMIHFIQPGHFLARFVFGPNRKANDAKEFAEMGDILMRGASAKL